MSGQITTKTLRSEQVIKKIGALMVTLPIMMALGINQGTINKKLKSNQFFLSLHGTQL